MSLKAPADLKIPVAGVRNGDAQRSLLGRRDGVLMLVSHLDVRA